MGLASDQLWWKYAELEDAPRIAEVENAASEALTDKYGAGPWTGVTTERAAERSIHTYSRRLMAMLGERCVGTLALQTKKPWAIDVSYFTPVKRAVYLVGMAVHPEFHGRGIGRDLLEWAENTAMEWDAQAIRLDAWDADAGAGGFYLKCGYQHRGNVVYRGTPLAYFERLVPLRP